MSFERQARRLGYCGFGTRAAESAQEDTHPSLPDEELSQKLRSSGICHYL
jgi:hypothetical protein